LLEGSGSGDIIDAKKLADEIKQKTLAKISQSMYSRAQIRYVPGNID
jgi:hypothetical protein